MTACTSESREKGVQVEVTVALSTLVKTGLFACDFSDHVAALTTKYSTAGLVGDRAVVPGLSEEARGDQSGLVPSSQMVRTVYSLKVVASKQDEQVQVVENS